MYFVSSSGFVAAFSPSNSMASSIASVKCKWTITCNYAGYEVEASKGAVSFVGANLTLPEINCSPTQNTEQIANFIVQIDGYRGSINDNDYAYIGVEAGCQLGTVSWSEVSGELGSNGDMSGTFSWPTAAAGDQISMFVKKATGNSNFNLTVIDHTRGLKISDVFPVKGVKQNAASCVVTPTAGQTIANFSTVNFQNCEATLSGKTRAIGAFGSSSLVEYFLYGSQGKRELVMPKTLMQEENFPVEFLRPG
jgi:hypothetical protein